MRDKALSDFLELCEENAQFRVAAEHLRSLGKFEEASSMFARSADHEENVMGVMGALQCLD